MPEIKLKFEPRDLWIGVRWNYRKSIESSYRRLEIYICVIPVFPIYVNWEWGWKNRNKMCNPDVPRKRKPSLYGDMKKTQEKK